MIWSKRYGSDSSQQHTNDVALALKHVTRRYGDGSAAVADISLEFTRRTTVLIGPSGSGKSTLLRLLAGLEFPDAGRVSVEGTALDVAALDAHRRRLGYVIQEGGLFPHLSAAENATLAARYRKRPKAEIGRRLEVLAELTHLPMALLDRYPDELSGGERQRVALMRALMLDPDLLLLDEPLGALDPLVRRELQEDLRAIFRRLGKLVVFVTHDLAEAAFFADHLVLVHQGRVEQQGSMRDLLEHPASAFVERFVNAQRVDWLHGAAS